MLYDVIWLGQNYEISRNPIATHFGLYLKRQILELIIGDDESTNYNHYWHQTVFPIISYWHPNPVPISTSLPQRLVPRTRRWWTGRGSRALFWIRVSPASPFCLLGLSSDQECSNWHQLTQEFRNPRVVIFISRKSPCTYIYGGDWDIQGHSIIYHL